MARGGARTNSGPPPDPTALRRDRPSDRDGWTALPAAGRPGRTPKWPLLPDVRRTTARDFLQRRVDELEDDITEARFEDNDRRVAELSRELLQTRRELATTVAEIDQQQKVERAMWREAWKLPQAIMWERLGWMRDVAQYVRHKTCGEMGSIKDAQEARQWSDRLGLNPSAMLRLRWRVTVDEVKAKRDERDGTPAAAARGDMRSRITAVTADGKA